MLTELIRAIISQHTHTHIKSSCCTPRTNTRLHVNYISIKLGKTKFKKKKEKNETVYISQNWGKYGRGISDLESFKFKLYGGNDQMRPGDSAGRR